MEVALLKSEATAPKFLQQTLYKQGLNIFLTNQLI